MFLQEGNNWQKIMHGSREKVEEKVFKKRWKQKEIYGMLCIIKMMNT